MHRLILEGDSDDGDNDGDDNDDDDDMHSVEIRLLFLLPKCTVSQNLCHFSEQ